MTTMDTAERTKAKKMFRDESPPRAAVEYADPVAEVERLRARLKAIDDAIAYATTNKRVDIAYVVQLVCGRFDVNISDLSDKTRHKLVVRAREFITLFGRKVTPLSFPEIARAIGRPNHSTVITAYQRVLNRWTDQDEADYQALAPAFGLGTTGGCGPC